MQFRAWGNWVGPGYSAGKHVPLNEPLSNADKRVRALDRVDEKAKKHDISYETQPEWLADLEWAFNPVPIYDAGVVLDSHASALFVLKSLAGYSNSDYERSAPSTRLIGIESNPGPRSNAYGANGATIVNGLSITQPISGVPTSFRSQDRDTSVFTDWGSGYYDWPTIPVPPSAGASTPPVPYRPVVPSNGRVTDTVQRSTDPLSYLTAEWQFTDGEDTYANSRGIGLPSLILKRDPIENDIVYDDDEPYYDPDSTMIDEVYRTPPNSSVPSPILVGVEPNPGPPKKHGKMTKKSHSKPKPAKKQHKAKKRTVVVEKKSKHKAPAKAGEKPYRIIRKECLGPVLSSAGFAINSYNLNPGNKKTFPWLSKIAAAFEFYKFKNLVFVYSTTSGNAVSSTNPALGRVAMVTSYDPLDPPFTDLTTLENYEGNTPGISSASFAHKVQVSGRRMGESQISERYVLVGNQPANTDIRFYNIGNFSIATEGQPATGNAIGELFVYYDIELFKPKDETPFGQSLPSAHIVGPTSTNVYPLCTNLPYQVVSGSLPGAQLLAGNGTSSQKIKFTSHGRYYVTIMWSMMTGSFTGAASLSGASIGAATASNYWTNVANMFYSQSSAYFNVSATSAATLCFYIDTVPDSLGILGNPVIEINGPVGTWTASVDVLITQVSSGLTAPVPLTMEQKLSYLMDQIKFLQDPPTERESPYFIPRTIQEEAEYPPAMELMTRRARSTK